MSAVTKYLSVKVVLKHKVKNKPRSEIIPDMKQLIKNNKILLGFEPFESSLNLNITYDPVRLTCYIFYSHEINNFVIIRYCGLCYKH